MVDIGTVVLEKKVLNCHQYIIITSFLCYRMIFKLIVKDLFEIKQDLNSLSTGKKTKVKLMDTTTKGQTNKMSMLMLKIIR